MQQHSNGTCLIVEDSRLDQAMMARVVARSCHGMQVAVANTLEAARAVLAKTEISLILLDNNFPDGIGANFALELSQDARLSHIPVIMVTDWPSPFMWEKAAKAGVVYVVNKAEFGTHYVQSALERAPERRKAVG